MHATSDSDPVLDLIQLSTADTQTRRCFLLHIKPDCISEYVKVHQNVWPEMQAALRETGWRNYSLFLRPKDGLVAGYFEADDVDEAERLMSEHPINTRWQAEMAPFFVEGTNPEPLPQYFRLS